MAEKNVRVALDDVTDALELFACATCDGHGRVPEGFQSPDPVCGVCVGARYRSDASPAEAIEVLHTRGLWPWPVGDDAAPRWWCERCEGTDDLQGECEQFPCFRKSHPCVACDGGTDADPPSLAALVAVASLGDLSLRYAEGHARTLVGREPRIVWRVMPRDKVAALAEWVMSEQCAGPTLRVSRDLAALGVVAVALDGDRVTLAVEAL